MKRYLIDKFTELRIPIRGYELKAASIAEAIIHVTNPYKGLWESFKSLSLIFLCMLRIPIRGYELAGKSKQHNKCGVTNPYKGLWAAHSLDDVNALKSYESL